VNKYTSLFIYFVVISAIAFVARHFIEFGKFSDAEFLFAYFGILLGFAVTLYTFVVSQYQNIKDIIRDVSDEKKRDQKRALFFNVCEEIKDDLSLIFWLFIVAALFNIIPQKAISAVYVEHVKDALIFTLFILSLFAIWDLVQVTFKVSDQVGIKNDNA